MKLSLVYIFNLLNISVIYFYIRMSSGSNYSVSELRRIFIARQDAFRQLRERFTAQQTRLVERNENSGSLTIEQQNLNERVLVVRDAFLLTASLIFAVELLFYDYFQAQPNDQPQLRDQITAKIPGIGILMQHFESKVRELEGIDVTDAQ